MKKTLILGASANPERVAYTAAHRLTEAGHPVVNVGIRQGEVAGLPILTGQPALDNIDTVTLYISPKNQTEWYNYILSLKPRRVIFNPGTENRELAELAEGQGIVTEEACTLVLLSLNMY
jgi:predicted CoA-binding protein